MLSWAFFITVIWRGRLNRATYSNKSPITRHLRQTEAVFGGVDCAQHPSQGH